jgi:hypothetical protein
MKALTVCVGYDDLLEITLLRNLRHFSRFLVVTSPTDEATKGLVRDLQQTGRDNLDILETDAFWRDGASFRKWLAVEEGFDALGRDGWMCHIDADAILPDNTDWRILEAGNIYSARRRILEDPHQWSPDLDWKKLPLIPDRELPGCLHVFHADSEPVKTLPWYGSHWLHAGGGDSHMLTKWPRDHQRWLPFEILHLGKDGQNWHGRCTPRLDGTLPDGADENRRKMTEMFKLRQRFGYAKERIPQENGDPL